MRDKCKNDYELLVSGDDGVDHLADAVALEEPVLVAWRLVLQVLHYQPLQPLHLLVRRARHLQQRRRHLLSSFNQLALRVSLCVFVWALEGEEEEVS